MLQAKQAAINATKLSLNISKSQNVSKEELNGAERRKILENFIENDEALSLLLDFISNKHLGGAPSQLNHLTPIASVAD